MAQDIRLPAVPGTDESITITPEGARVEADEVVITAPRATPEERAQFEAEQDTLDASYQQHRESGSLQSKEQSLFQELGLDENGEPVTPQQPVADPMAPPPEAEDGVTAMDVAKDIGTGLYETLSTRAIQHGVTKGVNEAVDMLESAADWVTANVTGDIKVDGKGFEYFTPSEIKKMQDEGTYMQIPDIPNVDAPKSVTGNIASGVAQFLVGFKGADKALKAWKAASKAATAGKAATKGAIADFTVFDPYEKNLSNLIQENPDLANPLNEFLAIEGDDPEALARFKRSLEGLGLGVMTEGVIAVVRAIKAGRVARREAIASGKWSAEPVAELDEAQLSRLLGDTSKNNLILYNKVRSAEGGGASPAALRGGDFPTKVKAKAGKQIWQHEGKAKFSSFDDKPMWFTTEGDSFHVGDELAGTLRGHLEFKKPLVESEVTDELWGGLMDRARAADVPADEIKALTKEWRKQGYFSMGDYAWFWKLLKEEGYDGVIADVSTKKPHAVALSPRTSLKVVDDGGLFDTGAKPADGFDEEVRINFAKVQTGDDVKKLIKTMAELDAGGVEKARRGIRTWEQTKLSADQENAWKLVAERAQGQAYNAEQLKAVKGLWVATAQNLKTVTDEAFNNPNAASLSAFMHMQEVYRLVNREFMGAQAEAGRALNILRQPTGANENMARAMQRTLDEAGGQQTVMEMVKKMKKLSDLGDAAKLDNFVMKSGFAKTREAVAEVWINALLSNPVSHVANHSSGWATIASRLSERRIAEYISATIGDGNGVVSGETFAMMQGLMQGFKDAVVASAKSVRTGRSTLLQSETAQRQGALSAQTWNISSDTKVGKALDYLDVATQTPGRLMQAGDEFFKMVGYRMELHAQAARMAAADVAAGRITQEGVNTRMAEIIANPPENVHLEAVGEALYHTFTNKPAELPAAIANAWQRIPLIGIMSLPFKNTPINIMTYGFERTPLAPLVKTWREDISAGGARADLAMAKMAAGTMVMAMAMDLAMSGKVTGQGPVDPQERALFEREGKQRYSIKIGDQWVAFNRIEPIGTVFGLGADMIEIVANSDADQVDVERAFAAGTFAAANAMTSKTYMQGIADLMQAITDSKRYGEGYMRGLAGAVVPAGVAATARLTDPYMRAAWDITDTLKRRTPGLSDELPLRRDLWGRSISYKSGVGFWYDALSPIYIKKENPEPIDRELERLGYYPPMPDRSVTLTDPETFEQGKVDLRKYPEIYSRYAELAGNELKDEAFGMGAKDRLNAILTGADPLSAIYEMPELTDGPDGGKAGIIHRIISDYRQKAAKQLLEEFPELRAEIAANARPSKFNLE